MVPLPRAVALFPALLAVPTACAGDLRHQLRERALLAAGAAESPAAAASAPAAAAAPPLPHNVPHDEEHSGTPGDGGQPMVPRSHVPAGHALPSPEYWSYEAPLTWGSSYAKCGGREQSPVDLDWDKAVTSASKQNVAYLAQHASYHPLSGRSIRNNGHNLQVDGFFGNLALPDGTYEVRQFNFHFPSEHTVNGKPYAGELQIVHQKQGSEGTSDLAMVSVLLEVTDAPGPSPAPAQPVFAEELAFFENLGFGPMHPLALPAEHEEIQVAGQVNLGVFARQLELGFWHYEGSLTTPPCSEAVHWYVLQHPATVTQAMVNSFKALFPAPSNSRPVQPLNGRKVLFSEVDVPGEFPEAAAPSEPHAHPKSSASRAGAFAALTAVGILCKFA